jgi:hypothetical protein
VNAAFGRRDSWKKEGDWYNEKINEEDTAGEWAIDVGGKDRRQRMNLGRTEKVYKVTGYKGL